MMSLFHIKTKNVHERLLFFFCYNITVIILFFNIFTDKCHKYFYIYSMRPTFFLFQFALMTLQLLDNAPKKV